MALGILGIFYPFDISSLLLFNAFDSPVLCSYRIISNYFKIYYNCAKMMLSKKKN